MSGWTNTWVLAFHRKCPTCYVVLSALLCTASVCVLVLYLVDASLMLCVAFQRHNSPYLRSQGGWIRSASTSALGMPFHWSKRAQGLVEFRQYGSTAYKTSRKRSKRRPFW
eukprot:scaffold1471_cov413-Prasinococcus_capsulatus_cf.AAC.15